MCKRILACSISLLREKKWILKTVFDFTYERTNFANHFQKWIDENEKSQKRCS